MDKAWWMSLGLVGGFVLGVLVMNQNAEFRVRRAQTVAQKLVDVNTAESRKQIQLMSQQMNAALVEDADHYQKWAVKTIEACHQDIVKATSKCLLWGK